MTIYCITPATLEHMLADVFVELHGLVFDDTAAMAIVDRVYQRLAAGEGPVVYTAETIDALFTHDSDWLRARVRNGSVLQRVRDVLHDRLTDDWYLTHSA